jgi:hypothetical protein
MAATLRVADGTPVWISDARRSHKAGPNMFTAATEQPARIAAHELALNPA